MSSAYQGRQGLVADAETLAAQGLGNVLWDGFEGRLCEAMGSIEGYAAAQSGEEYVGALRTFQQLLHQLCADPLAPDLRHASSFITQGM